MTDKEIIDVTKCLHFDKSDIPNGCTCYWDGECNHYCYYKQLKRKEQEYEMLKEDRERWKSNFNGKVSAIEELLQQLDQLKRKEQALDEIEKYLDAQQKYFDGEDYHNLLDIINKVKEEINEES